MHNRVVSSQCQSQAWIKEGDGKNIVAINCRKTAKYLPTSRKGVDLEHNSDLNVCQNCRPISNLSCTLNFLVCTIYPLHFWHASILAKTPGRGSSLCWWCLSPCSWFMLWADAARRRDKFFYITGSLYIRMTSNKLNFNSSKIQLHVLFSPK